MSTNLTAPSSQKRNYFRLRLVCSPTKAYEGLFVIVGSTSLASCGNEKWCTIAMYLLLQSKKFHVSYFMFKDGSIRFQHEQASILQAKNLHVKVQRFKTNYWNKH